MACTAPPGSRSGPSLCRPPLPCPHGHSLGPSECRGRAAGVPKRLFSGHSCFYTQEAETGRGTGSAPRPMPSPHWAGCRADTSSLLLGPGGSSSCAWSKNGDQAGMSGRQVHTEDTPQGPRGPGTSTDGRPRPLRCQPPSHTSHGHPCPAMARTAQAWGGPCPTSVCRDRVCWGHRLGMARGWGLEDMQRDHHRAVCPAGPPGPSPPWVSLSVRF